MNLTYLSRNSGQTGVIRIMVELADRVESDMEKF